MGDVFGRMVRVRLRARTMSNERVQVIWGKGSYFVTNTSYKRVDAHILFQDLQQQPDTRVVFFIDEPQRTFSRLNFFVFNMYQKPTKVNNGR